MKKMLFLFLLFSANVVFSQIPKDEFIHLSQDYGISPHHTKYEFKLLNSWGTDDNKIFLYQVLNTQENNKLVAYRLVKTVPDKEESIKLTIPHYLQDEESKQYYLNSLFSNDKETIGQFLYYLSMYLGFD